MLRPKYLKFNTDSSLHMTVQSSLLAQDERQNQLSEPHRRPQQRLIQVPSGHACWPGWLSGKALPLAIFTMFLAINSLTLPSQIMQLIREGVPSYQGIALLRHFLVLGFSLLVVAAYLTRTHAVARAQGFWERFFPMLVLIVTFAGTLFLDRSSDTYYSELIGAGLLVTLLGDGVSLWALWYLRGSFAIMAEARSPVTSGPYHYVRHPLYLGETLTMLGLCVAIGTVPAILFWVIWTGMQVTRARIEEAKLANRFDDYKVYLERTRFIIPGFY
jgi:protein-S-isoprenylcysteine O-methyltransferase Ste14